MPRNFNERTTDRVVATADDRSSAIIARTALRRVMAESNSLYTKPYLTDWVENKINLFKINLNKKIEQDKRSTKLARNTHFPELYAKMLREELEYIELCIEYNDKTKSTTDKDNEPPKKRIVIATSEDDGPIKNPNDKAKIIGKIDLDDIE